MSCCIKNINRFIVPNDIINSLTQIYKYIGKNEYYDDIIKNDYPKIIEQTVEKDTFFLSKILKLGITDSRLNLLISKKATPKNREENSLINIKEILLSFQLKPESYTYQSSSLLNLINYIYQNQNIQYETVRSQNKRSDVDEINQLTNDIIAESAVEPIILSLNYFIDLYNIKPFNDKNITLSYLVLFLMFKQFSISAFKYVSFFEMIYNNYSRYEELLIDASYNWNDGYSQNLGFIRFVINLVLGECQKADELVLSYKIDANINKQDNIENTIKSLGSIFTKDQIRAAHPYVSESTINRALKKMRDERSIKPLGKGRSAKWIKTTIF